jgi:hypothetical protein
MTTKALFIASLGGDVAVVPPKEFVRTSGDILTAAAHGLQTGAGPFKAMTTSAGDVPSGLVAAVRATTFVTAVAVIATDIVIIDGKTYTFIATPAADGDVDVGASDVASMENLARAINLGPGAGTDYDIDTVGNPNITAEARGATCIITAKTLDAAIGNAIAVSTPDSTLTWDNATLQGGVDGTEYFVIRLDDGTFSLALTKAAAIAGTAVALADAGTGVHTLVSTSQSLADALEDVVVNRLTATGIRVNDASQNIADFWQTAIDGVAN